MLYYTKKNKDEFSKDLSESIKNIDEKKKQVMQDTLPLQLQLLNCTDSKYYLNVLLI